MKEALRKKSPAEVNEEFKGTTVVTSYSKSGKRTYKVERIDFDATPESTFKKKDGSEIIYREYFMQQYGVRINEKNQPLLVFKNQRTGVEAYLVPEICELTGLTESRFPTYERFRS